MAQKHQDLIARMTLEDKVALCSGADSWTTRAFPQYGIPSIMMTDGPHGLRKQNSSGVDTPGVGNSVPATCFPAACATACSWDPNLLREMGAAIAEEALQEGVSIVLGPGVNIKRNPLCGRNFEYFSEDPYLAGEMAAAWVNGLQSKGIGASLKHFAANSQETQRMVSDSIVDERALHELYLAAFEKVVKDAKPATLMCAYNLLNGTYCSGNSTLLRDILRQGWGFEGVVVSDWGATFERIPAFNAGMDLEMPGSNGFFDRGVIESILSGKLPEARVDECVNRLLELVFTSASSRQPGYRYDADAHHRLAQKIAASSVVLLKNDDKILPLRKGQRIALIGAQAKEPRYQGAGSSFINPTRLSSAVDGFTALGLDFTYFPGYALKGPASAELLAEAAAGAQASDVALVFAGLTEEIESEGFDRVDMKLPQAHNELIERVAEANPNTVVVLSSGAPVEMPWLPKVKAVLHMGLAGQAGGLAAAELLSGAVNPSGKLAESYPFQYEDVPSAGFYAQGGKQAQYRESIYVGYRYYDKARKAVCFPFGHGLSYTTFEYSSLALSRTEMLAGERLDVTVKVKNTGDTDGAEVVQLYVSDSQHSAFRPEKELKDFAKISLRAGEEKQVSFRLDSRSFACYYPAAKDWLIPNGTYTILVGASSRDIRAQAKVVIIGTQRLPVDNLKAPERSGLHRANWYTSLSGEPTQADFEQLLGKPIQPVKQPKKGEYSLDSTLKDMSSSFIIRQVIRSFKNQIRKGYGNIDPNDPNYRMSIETVLNMPLKTLVVMSGGMMSSNTIEGLVHLANGKVWNGLRAFLRKFARQLWAPHGERRKQ